MTAKIFYLPVLDHRRTPEENARLDAAVHWLLSELGVGAALEPFRALAEKELERPRDEIHRRWAEAFLESVRKYPRKA